MSPIPILTNEMLMEFALAHMARDATRGAARASATAHTWPLNCDVANDDKLGARAASQALGGLEGGKTLSVDSVGGMEVPRG